MTANEIKKEANSLHFSTHRFKAMPAYGVAFFVIVNILLLSAVFYAFLTNAVGVHIFISVIIGAYCALLLLLALCLSGQFSYSVDEYFLLVAENESEEAHFSFGGYDKKNFIRTMLARLLGFFVTLVLTCLAIVPGVIFGIKTSMTYYVMKNDPKIGMLQAMRKSSVIMKKHGMQYLRLGFSFLGWFLLCIVTLGLGFIFVLPYFNCSKAIFYKRILCDGAAEIGAEDEVGEVESVRADGEVTVEVVANDEPIICVPSDADVSSISGEQSENIVNVQDNSDSEVTVIIPENMSSEPSEAPSDSEVVIIAPASDNIKADHAEEVNAEPVREAAVSVEEKHEDADVAAESNTNSRDAIKQRIEQLKRERNAHASAARPQRPAAQDNIKADARRKVGTDKPPIAEKRDRPEPAKNELPKSQRKSDEFAPEKIEVEIVED